jgi:hypothetical protein
VKRAVTEKLLNHRAIRSRGIPNLLVMSRRLKVLMQAEAAGDHNLAEKLRRGIIPSDTEGLIEAMNLLRAEEAESPLMTQFALAATQVGKALQDVRDHCSLLEQISAAMSRQRMSLRMLLTDIQCFAALLPRLSEAQRMHF